MEYCSWSNVPDEDFALADDYDWTIGQFVWTGFDYLGEPSPYDTDAWPSHSSVFGIIDLASLPKDRYYLFRSGIAGINKDGSILSFPARPCPVRKDVQGVCGLVPDAAVQIIAVFGQKRKSSVPPANLIIWNWLPTAPGLLPTVKTLPTSPSALSIKTAISARRTIVLFLSL